MATDISVTEVSPSLRRIAISGRLDIIGTDSIAIKFAAASVSAEKRVVVDLSQVGFLASIGIRALITNAKSLQQRGGKLVLFVGDNEAVLKTLEVTGIDALIPLFRNAADADQAALA